MYDNSYPRSSCTDKPTNSDQRRRYDDAVLGKQRLVINPYGCEHAAKAARAIVFLEFGRSGAALDQANFVDRRPDLTSRRVDARPAGRAA